MGAKKTRTTKGSLYRVTMEIEIEVSAEGEDDAIDKARHEVYGDFDQCTSVDVEELTPQEWPEWVPEHMREPMVEADFTDHIPDLMRVRIIFGGWWMTNGHVALSGEGVAPACATVPPHEPSVPETRIKAVWVDAQLGSRPVKLHPKRVIIATPYYALVEACFPGCTWEVSAGAEAEIEAVVAMRDGHMVALVMPVRGIADAKRAS